MGGNVILKSHSRSSLVGTRSGTTWRWTCCAFFVVFSVVKRTLSGCEFSVYMLEVVKLVMAKQLHSVCVCEKRMIIGDVYQGRCKLSYQQEDVSSSRSDDISVRLGHCANCTCWVCSILLFLTRTCNTVHVAVSSWCLAVQQYKLDVNWRCASSGWQALASAVNYRRQLVSMNCQSTCYQLFISVVTDVLCFFYHATHMLFVCKHVCCDYAWCRYGIVLKGVFSTSCSLSNPSFFCTIHFS